VKKDHLEIILEDIQGKFDLVLEGHDAIRQEFGVRFDVLEEKVEMNTSMIQALNHKIDTVDASLNNKIDAVETSLNKRIDAVETKLNKKIDDVEKSLGKKIEAVGADLAAHRLDTESHARRYRVSEE